MAKGYRNWSARLFSASAALVALVGNASAADISDAFYLDLSGGPAVFMLHMNQSNIDNAIANTYWGADGRFGICSKGVFNVCGGVTGFASLGSTSQSVSSNMGGGETQTQINSIGAYLQGTANLGVITLSPFAGYRQVFGDISVDGGSTLQLQNINTGAYYGGLESSVKFWPSSLELGARIEYGRSVSDVGTKDFDYGLGSAFLRMRF